MPFKKKLNSYSLLTAVLLGILAIIYLINPQLRLITAITIGLVYFLSGILSHLHDKSLHLLVVLEYLGIGLLGIIILIFISLRA